MQMDARILKDFETFEEFPDGVLKIDKNTNLVYIQKGTETFVAREYLKKMSGDNSNLEYELKYKDVIDNKVRLTAEIKKQNEKTIINYPKEPFKVYGIIHLNEILNVKENSPYYLTLEDIINLCSFKEEESTEKRKYYF